MPKRAMPFDLHPECKRQIFTIKRYPPRFVEQKSIEPTLEDSKAYFDRLEMATEERVEQIRGLSVQDNNCN